jgi:predicted nucleic acid-binding Zn ribbon protein
VLGKVARTTQSGRVLELLWREAAGEGIADNAHPLRLEDACLWISVPTARWAAELERQAPTLRERLVARLGPGVVTRLAFRIVEGG